MDNTEKIYKLLISPSDANVKLACNLSTNIKNFSLDGFTKYAIIHKKWDWRYSVHNSLAKFYDILIRRLNFHYVSNEARSHYSNKLKHLKLKPCLKYYLANNDDVELHFELKTDWNIEIIFVVKYDITGDEPVLCYNDIVKGANHILNYYDLADEVFDTIDGIIEIDSVKSYYKLNKEDILPKQKYAKFSRKILKCLSTKVVEEVYKTIRW